MTRKKHALLILPLIAAATFYYFGSSDETVRIAPLVPRLSAADHPPARVVGTHELLNWARAKTPMSLVNTATDILPNGLALAMLPLFVDWEASRISGEQPFVLVRNVNVGGNPLAGTTLLATVRVPLRGLRELEWCTIRDRNEENEDTLMGHGLLRFIFDAATRPLVLNDSGSAFHESALLDDMILSWEAWRPPSTPFDAATGLAPGAYAISTRAYAGELRFLKDALSNKAWACYPVALPATDDAVSTAFLVGLAMGDALARRMVHAMVENGDITGTGLDQLMTLRPEELKRIRAIYSDEAMPEDPLQQLMGQLDLSYNTLLRSCMTQSLTAIQLAVDRIHADNKLGDPPAMRIVPDLPAWIDDLATASDMKMLATLPDALLYLANNTQILPREAYRIPAAAGLLKRRNGKLIIHYYHRENITPYGRLVENMM